MAGVSTGNRALKGRASRKLPSIELPRSQDHSINRAFENIAEYLRTYEGDGTAPKERFVTMRELEESGLVTLGTKNGYSFISQVLKKDVAQTAGSTANPTLKGTIKKDTALGLRTPGGGGGGASNPLEQGKRGITQKLSDIGNVAVASPAQTDFLYYDGGKWKNYSLFKRENKWLKKQNFEAGFSISGTDFTDNSTNWDTAFSWGDHSSAGYLGDLVDDLTPQLGGDLDANGSNITLSNFTDILWKDTLGTPVELLTFHSNDEFYVGSSSYVTNVRGSSVDITNGTLNGYALSSVATAAPGASQIVKTHTNGYTYLGWINTVSGATVTDPVRIYCSEDAFLRYMTPAAFIDFLQDETWDVGGDWDFKTMPQCDYGIGGGYNENSGSSTFGATVWSLDTSWTGGKAGPNSANTAVYGIRWLRGSHTSAFSTVGEGLYTMVNGTIYSGMGQQGFAVPASGDVTKVSHGNYLYHQSTSYDNDQNGGVTFSTSAASGGTTGDIWFEYT